MAVKSAPPRDRVTAKHRSFLKLIAEGMTEHQAATQVWSGGYAKQKRYRKNPTVCAMIDAVQTAIADDTKITRDEVIEGIQEAVQMAMNLEDPSTAIKGWQELAKMHGYYEPERKVNVHVHRTEIELNEMSTKELLEITGNQPITLDAQDYETVEVEVPDDEDLEDDVEAETTEE